MNNVSRADGTQRIITMPCPFCDSTEVQQSTDSHNVKCKKCGATGPEASSQDAAIKSWNQVWLAVRIAKTSWQEIEAGGYGGLPRHKWKMMQRLQASLRIDRFQLLDEWGRNYTVDEEE